MKDLRSHYDYDYEHDNIRFYAAGEYGSLTSRPHYHLLLFNLPIKELQYFRTNENHDKIYLSNYLSDIWGKGYVTVGAVTFESAAYVARYIMKKITGEPAEDHYCGRHPEFTRMSRRPGIAHEWYEQNKGKMYETDEIIFKAGKGKTLSIKPTKYYDRLYDVE